jgi:hypothetical protein
MYRLLLSAIQIDCENRHVVTGKDETIREQLRARLGMDDAQMRALYEKNVDLRARMSERLTAEQLLKCDYKRCTPECAPTIGTSTLPVSARAFAEKLKVCGADQSDHCAH